MKPRRKPLDQTSPHVPWIDSHPFADGGLLRRHYDQSGKLTRIESLSRDALVQHRREQFKALGATHPDTQQVVPLRSEPDPPRDWVLYLQYARRTLEKPEKLLQFNFLTKRLEPLQKRVPDPTSLCGWTLTGGLEVSQRELQKATKALKQVLSKARPAAPRGRRARTIMQKATMDRLCYLALKGGPRYAYERLVVLVRKQHLPSRPPTLKKYLRRYMHEHNVPGRLRLSNPD